MKNHSENHEALILQMRKPELEGPENHPQEKAVSLGPLFCSSGAASCMGFLDAGLQVLFASCGKEAGEHKYNCLRIYHLTKKSKTKTKTKMQALSLLCFILLRNPARPCNHGNTSPTTALGTAALDTWRASPDAW